MDRADRDNHWARDALSEAVESRFEPPLPWKAGRPALSAWEMLARLPGAAYATDAGGTLIYYNDAAAGLWGMRPSLGQFGWWRQWRLLNEDGTPLHAAEARLLAAGPAGTTELACIDGEGRRRTLIATTGALPGLVSGSLTLLVDITDRVAAEAALRAREERYRYTVELGAQLPWMADADGRMVEMDPRWLALTGMGRDQLADGGGMAAVHPDDVARLREQWATAMRTEHPLDAEHRTRLADGSYRWFRTRAQRRRAADGSVVGWYGTTEDIHDHRLAEDEVRWTAEHDALTELPNRRAFRHRLHNALAAARADGGTAGLLLLDIDHFKQVNDQLGHDAGDALLQLFAERLRCAVPEVERLARLGGDEFAVLLPGANSAAEIKSAGDELLASLHAPFEYRDQMHDCRATIGAALFPRDGADGDELLKSADIALYEAKTRGRGHVQVFRSGMRAELQRRASMISLARDALARGAVAPFYQPKVNLASGRVCGFEALLRWRHDRNGWQLPGSIAAAFEDVELAARLSDAMLDRVIADIKAWQALGVEPGRVAINASAAELSHSDYAERVLSRLDAAGLPGAALELEVTEMVFLGAGADHVGEALGKLCAAGVAIALDDFGTGFASLSHLKQFPVDVIKIDRSFICELNGERADLAILRALIGLGRNLGIVTVAEGIETRAQAARLRIEGCPIGQGFLFSPAVPGDVVPALLRDWDRDRARGRSC